MTDPTEEQLAEWEATTPEDNWHEHALIAEVRRLRAEQRDERLVAKLQAASMKDAMADAGRLRGENERLREHGCHPENPGKTHFEGCWKTRGHHECAIAEAERLAQPPPSP